jgi:hypothetical protein
MAKLVCFIGSHITSGKLPLIKQLFESINSQTRLCVVYMSWSCDKDCIHEFEDLTVKTNDIEFFYSKQRLSQFEHYKNIMSKISNKDNLYVMLSDDHNIWNNCRVEKMYEILNKTTKTSVHICTDCTDCKEDYLPIIVPFVMLKEFYHITPEWIIGNRYCDVRFCAYITTCKSYNLTQTVLYHTICGNSTYGSSKEIHEHMEKLKCKVKPRLLEALALLTKEDTNVSLSLLCRNMEMSVVKHYPKQPPLQEFDGYRIMFELEGLDKQDKLLGECLLKIYPALESWAKEVYNLSDEIDQSDE